MVRRRRRIPRNHYMPLSLRLQCLFVNNSYLFRSNVYMREFSFTVFIHPILHIFVRRRRSILRNVYMSCVLVYSPYYSNNSPVWYVGGVEFVKTSICLVFSFHKKSSLSYVGDIELVESSICNAFCSQCLFFQWFNFIVRRSRRICRNVSMPRDFVNSVHFYKSVSLSYVGDVELVQMSICIESLFTVNILRIIRLYHT